MNRLVACSLFLIGSLCAAQENSPLQGTVLTPDGQPEWLELTWKKPVEAVGIDVYETFNPGALTRITSFDADRKETTLWEGTDPTPPDAKDGRGVSQIRFEKPVVLSTVRLYLDSPAVPGWNEIDAVGLLESSGTVHWATGATASSTYAEQRRMPGYSTFLER